MLRFLQFSYHQEQRRDDVKNRHYDEMVNVVLPWVTRVNRMITWPVIRKKMGIEIVSKGRNFGEIQTDLDIGISQVLLDGAPKLDIAGLRSMYPGSFSEEQDSLERTTALTIYEVDPLDGTGDFKKTHQTTNVIPPTTLVAKLERGSVNDLFVPVAGMIFEILNEYALVGDESKIGLYKIMPDGSIKNIPFEFEWHEEKLTGHHLAGNSVVRLNRRHAYPQYNFDVAFKEFCDKSRWGVIQIPTGGAGLQALQFFRQYIHPTKGTLTAFEKLEELDVVFNCQPDWKTWDTDPSQVIARAIAKQNYEQCKSRVYTEDYRRPRLETNIFSHPLAANATAVSLKDMWHRSGCIMTGDRTLEDCMLQAADEFMKITGKNLLEINY